jgi:cytochrome b subunit of formate dehydrogenase
VTVNPEQQGRLIRFTVGQRLFHLVLMLSFLTQATTGLARMYHETAWGSWLGRIFGGFDLSLRVHIYVGIFMICAFLIHLVYLLLTIRWRQFPSCIVGPDSLVLGKKDLKNFWRHTGWILGLKRHPPLERWSYWEKFDYWAVFWGMIILGGTGLLLAWPLGASRYIPGWGLNVAFWIHRIESVLAMAHIFVIHFFIAHLRRTSFPMDLAIFEGSVPLSTVEHERPEWITRLRQGGQYYYCLVGEASPWRRAIFYVFGYLAVGTGLFLLIGALVNSMRISW